jgi:hypothetical protein
MIGGSVVMALLAAVVLFHAPLIPAVLGAGGAGALIYWRARRAPA